MTTIFAIVLTMAILISGSLAFIIIKHLLRERKTKKLLADFHQVAAEFDFFTSKLDVLGNRVIAWDAAGNRLFFFPVTNHKHDGYLVDLGEVKTSSVKREYGLIKSGSKYRANMEPYIKKITLQLEYKNGAKPLALDFYKKATDPVSQMRERAAKALEWQSLLPNRLKNEVHTSGIRKKPVKANYILN